MENKNILFLVTGPSGSGKTTVMRNVMNNEIISFTTREPRPGEKDGVDYHYITKEKFKELLDNDGLVEWVEYGGNYYGITKEEIDHKLSLGHAFLICTIEGVQQVMEYYPNCVTIFIYSDLVECIYRMHKRGDSDETIRKRAETYFSELLNRVAYDWVVKNREGMLEATIRIVRDIITAEMLHQTKGNNPSKEEEEKS